MDTSRLSQGELIAGISGLALFVVLFLPWYGVDVNVAGFSASENASAWEAFDMTDILLFLVAVVAVGAAPAGSRTPCRRACLWRRSSPGRGALALLLVLYRLIELPVPDVRREWPPPASTSGAGSGSSSG